VTDQAKAVSPEARPTGFRLASGPSALLLCLLLGAASVPAFAPFRFWPLLLITLTGFVWLCDRAATPRRAALLGMTFGLGYFLAGVSWIYVSLHNFGGMAVPLAAFATAFFCTYLALYPAAVAWLIRRAPVRRGARLALAFPGLWALSEWTRGWVFTGFPWLAIGYAQSPTGPLSGFAPVIGAYGVSLLTALTAGLLAWWQPWLRLREGARSLLHPALPILAVTWVGGVVLHHIAWTRPSGEPVTVTLIQGNIEQDMKWRPEWVRASLDTYLKLTLTSRSRLTLLPETALPMLNVDVPRDYFQALAEHARENGGDLLLGIPELAEGTPSRYFNSVISLGSSPAQVYRKHHLVPFGDYFPRWFFITWVMNALDIPMSDFSRGDARQQPLAVAGQHIAVNICYEDVFGEEIIRQLPKATILANFTNDAWWGDSIASEQHLQKAQMRAQETGRYMLRATNTGVTAIIDERGRLRAAGPEFVATTVQGAVQGFTGSTPYIVVGNWAFLALSAVMLVTAALGRPR
jgi:apolipoprotein N-acyltransferase